jgi:hypothetical protein
VQDGSEVSRALLIKIGHREQQVKKAIARA